MYDLIIAALQTDAIPSAYATDGHLHIAYEYAYAKTLTLQWTTDAAAAELLLGTIICSSALSYAAVKSTSSEPLVFGVALRTPL